MAWHGVAWHGVAWQGIKHSNASILSTHPVVASNFDKFVLSQSIHQQHGLPRRHTLLALVDPDHPNCKIVLPRLELVAYKLAVLSYNRENDNTNAGLMTGFHLFTLNIVLNDIPHPDIEPPTDKHLPKLHLLPELGRLGGSDKGGGVVVTYNHTDGFAAMTMLRFVLKHSSRASSTSSTRNDGGGGGGEESGLHFCVRLNSVGDAKRFESSLRSGPVATATNSTLLGFFDELDVQSKEMIAFAAAAMAEPDMPCAYSAKASVAVHFNVAAPIPVVQVRVNQNDDRGAAAARSARATVVSVEVTPTADAMAMAVAKDGTAGVDVELPLIDGKERPTWELEEGRTACPPPTSGRSGGDGPASVACTTRSADDGRTVVTFSSQDFSSPAAMAKFVGVYRHPTVVSPDQSMLVNHPVTAHMFIVVDKFYLDNATR